jgi:hypothetical protein
MQRYPANGSDGPLRTLLFYRLSKGHQKGEASFLPCRAYGQRTLMCLCDLRGNVETEAKTLPTRSHLASEERLEQPVHGRLRYGFPAVSD